jgi:hypothetical protein
VEEGEGGVSKKITDPFVIRRRSLYESQAWRSLTPLEKLVVEAVELEHMNQHGKANGKLFVLYDDVRRYVGQNIPGARLKRVFLGLARKGFLICTEPGRSKPGRGRKAARYHATWLPTTSAGPTNQWREYLTNEIEKYVRKVRKRLEETSANGQTKNPRDQASPGARDQASLQEKSNLGTRRPWKVQGPGVPTSTHIQWAPGETVDSGASMQPGAAPNGAAPKLPWFRPTTGELSPEGAAPYLAAMRPAS